MKTCSCCNLAKSLEDFYRAKGNKDGLTKQCKDCISSYHARRYQRDKEKIQQRQRDYFIADPERRREQGRRWARNNYDPDKAKIDRRKHYLQHIDKYREIARMKNRALRASSTFDRERQAKAWADFHKRNPTARAEAQRKYVKLHPDRVIATKNNNKAKRKAASGKVTVAEWREIVEFYNHACALCETPESIRRLTVDHFIPIIKGGENTWSNVWPLCQPCNSAKRAKLLFQSAPPHVFLIRARTETA